VEAGAEEMVFGARQMYEEGVWSESGLLNAGKKEVEDEIQTRRSSL